MRARAAPRRNEDGKIIRWYGTLEDIDDHKKAEEALRRSEARLQAIFDAVPIGIVIADAPDGRVVMSNPRAEEILRRADAAPRTIDEYRRSGARRADGTLLKAEEYPLARAILHGETTPPEEVLYQYSDGSSAWISLSAAPVLDDDGKVSGGVVTIHDIDKDRREMERLAEMAATLKNKLATHR
jgi:PAS domain S-box-containing protein